MALCAMSNTQLPVPLSSDDNDFLASLGSTYLGIRGKLEDGIIIWKNIYKEVWPQNDHLYIFE